MIREFGYIFPLNCNAQQGTFEYYNCNPYFTDVPTNEFFFPYVQKAYDLIGNLAKPPNCYYGSFCPWEQVARGYFSYYAVSLIMNASTPYSLPNGGNLPNVTAPYNPQAGIYMSCESAATQNLIAGNMYVGVDANHVYTYASTAFPTGLMWPSLWMSYVWRQVSGPAPPYPAVADARLGNATKAELQSGSFSVSAGQTYTHTTKHGVISGCVSPPPAEMPYIISTQTNSASITTQIITTSPQGLSLTVDGAQCGGTCSYQWLTGTRHSLSAPVSQNLGGAQYQFGTWSNGGTSTHLYDTPSSSGHVVASYAKAYAPTAPLSVVSIADPVVGGTVTPSSGPRNAGTVITLQATPAIGYEFDSWTISSVYGTTTTTSNPAYLTVNAATRVVGGFRQRSNGILRCVTSSNPTVVGRTVTLAASAEGFTSPLPAYSWTGAVTGAGHSVEFTPTEPGGYLAKVSAGSHAAYCLVAVAHPVVDSLRTFLGEGEGVYTIPTGTHIVPPQFGSMTLGKPVYTNTYLHIARSNITISGSGPDPKDTVLKRGTWFTGGLPAPWPSALEQPKVDAEFVMNTLSAAITNVTMRNLTFDGNRYAPGLNCLPGNSAFYDLDVSLGGKFTLERLLFVRSPGDAVFLAGPDSSISLSDFGEENAPATAIRSTGITLRGTSDITAKTAALSNNVRYAGTAGIRVEGQRNFVYGNLLESNRYELSDGAGGGQLYLSPGSSDTIVAGNVIDGAVDGVAWPPFGSRGLRVATECTLPSNEPQHYNAGVEGYGTQHSFYNNEVVNHTGTGMQFAGSNPTGLITISGAPLRVEDETKRFIENSGNGGITFLGRDWCLQNEPYKSEMHRCGITAGVLLDAIRVANNRKHAVALDISGTDTSHSTVIDKSRPPAYATFTGFFNGSCQTENDFNGAILIGQSLITPLAHPQASDTDTYWRWFNIPPELVISQPCPTPPWPTTIPPRAPKLPGWPW